MPNPISDFLKQRRYSRLRSQYGLTNFPEMYRDLCVAFPFSSISVHPRESFFFALYGILSAEISGRRDFVSQFVYPESEMAREYASSLEDRKDEMRSLYRMLSESKAGLNRALDEARMQFRPEALAPTLNTVFEALRDELLPQYHDLAQEIARRSDTIFTERHAGF